METACLELELGWGVLSEGGPAGSTGPVGVETAECELLQSPLKLPSGYSDCLFPKVPVPATDARQPAQAGNLRAHASGTQFVQGAELPIVPAGRLYSQAAAWQDPQGQGLWQASPAIPSYRGYAVAIPQPAAVARRRCESRQQTWRTCRGRAGRRSNSLSAYPVTSCIPC